MPASAAQRTETLLETALKSARSSIVTAAAAHDGGDGGGIFDVADDESSRAADGTTPVAQELL